MGYTTSMTGISYIDVRLKKHVMGVYKNDTSNKQKIVSVTARVGVGAAGAAYTAGDAVYGTGAPITINVTCGSATTNSYTTSKSIGVGGNPGSTYPLKANGEVVTLTFTSDVIVDPGESVTLTIHFSGSSGAFIFDYGKESVSTVVYNPVIYYTVSYDANGGSDAPASQTKASNANLTLTTSKPTSKKLTLTFDANGGTVGTSSKQYDASFTSWNTNSSGTGTNYNPGGTFTTNANTTLYAKWGSATVTGLPTPSNGSSIFKGWFTSGGTQITENSKISLDTTVYAKWQSTYTVSYNGNGGSGVPASQTKRHGETLTLSSNKPTTSKKLTVTFDANGGTTSTSYKQYSAEFVSWNTTSSGSGTNYNPGGSFSTDQNTVLYAKWGSATVSGLPTPSKSSNIFKGWFTSDGVQITNGSLISSSVTVYARWQPTYIVSYNANGGSGAPSSQTKKHNETLVLTTSKPSTSKSIELTFNANGGLVSPTSSVRQCSFLRWNTSSNGSGTNYYPGGDYTANSGATLYAVWSSASAGTLPTPARSNCIFVDWYTGIDGGYAVYDSTTFTSDTTLYARWDYIISYDLNGGVVGEDGSGEGETSIADDIKRHNESLKLTSILPRKTGKSFLGWSANKSATSPDYLPGASYTKNEPIKLYAVYGVQKFTVTFDLREGQYTGGGDLVQQVEYGKDAVLPNDPTYKGKVFKGWIGEHTNIIRDTTIYALWNGSPVWIMKNDKEWHSYVE